MTKIATMAPYRDRARREIGVGRCCWVCGKVGGVGFTHALQGAGYRMRRGEIGYAHPDCMGRAMKEAAEHERNSNTGGTK
jgi:hypothetical protein